MQHWFLLDLSVTSYETDNNINLVNLEQEAITGTAQQWVPAYFQKCHF